MTVFITHAKIDLIMKRGLGHQRELAHLVPEILKKPAAIFQGVRDGEKDWLCYSGIPSKSFLEPGGQELPPRPKRVYLVFVNRERVVYNFRWEPCDPANPLVPENHESRFGRKAL